VKTRERERGKEREKRWKYSAKRQDLVRNEIRGGTESEAEVEVDEEQQQKE